MVTAPARAGPAAVNSSRIAPDSRPGPAQCQGRHDPVSLQPARAHSAKLAEILTNPGHGASRAGGSQQLTRRIAPCLWQGAAQCQGKDQSVSSTAGACIAPQGPLGPGPSETRSNPELPRSRQGRRQPPAHSARSTLPTARAYQCQGKDQPVSATPVRAPLNRARRGLDLPGAATEPAGSAAVTSSLGAKCSAHGQDLPSVKKRISQSAAPPARVSLHRASGDSDQPRTATEPAGQNWGQSTAHSSHNSFNFLAHGQDLPSVKERVSQSPALKSPGQWRLRPTPHDQGASRASGSHQLNWRKVPVCC